MKFIFVGFSNSGKTTLGKQLARKYDLKRMDILDYAEPYIEEYIKKYGSGNFSFKKIHQSLVRKIKLGKIDFDIFETAVDDPEEEKFLEKIIETLKQTDSEIVLVFCRCSWSTALTRDWSRNDSDQVSLSILEKERPYNCDYFFNLSRKLDIAFFSILTEKITPQESFEGLITVLELAGIEIE